MSEEGLVLVVCQNCLKEVREEQLFCCEVCDLECCDLCTESSICNDCCAEEQEMTEQDDDIFDEDDE